MQSNALDAIRNATSPQLPGSGPLIVGGSLPQSGGYTGGSSPGITSLSPYNQNGLFFNNGGYIPTDANQLALTNPQPNPTNQTTLDTGNGPGSGQTFQDTSAARLGTQSTLDQLARILANNQTEAQGEYDAIKNQYDTEEAENLASYNKNRETNEGNRGAQNQAALLAAANGGRGLNSVLASLGALGGTGQVLANRAVANEANIDVGNANKTFDTNAANLFDSYGKIKKEEDQRQLNAKKTLKDTKQKNNYDKLTKEQSLYKEMAGHWTNAGNNGKATEYMQKFAGLSPQVANTSAPSVAAYANTPLNYSAPALDNYLAGANDMTVNTSSAAGSPVNGAVYTSTREREEV